MKNTRKEKHGKQKKKKGKIIGSIFLILFLLAGGAAAYLYNDYNKALEKSKAETDLSQKDIEFNGVEDIKGKVNVLLLGVDAREEGEQARTDTIMIAQYDPDQKKTKLVSLMRDSYVEIPGHGKQKLNAAFVLGGTELVRQTIKENFDIDLQYYSMIDFKGFTKMIDAAFPEGIEINVEKAMSKNIGVSLQPGLQKLNGKELLGYVRYRHDARSDFGRVERQQTAIKKIADEVSSVQGVMKLPAMFGTIQPYIATNMEKTKLLSIGTSFLTSSDREIESFTIPQEGMYQNKRYPNAGLVLELDLERNKQALHEFMEQ